MIFAILQLFQEQLNTDMIKLDEPYVGKIAIQKVLYFFNSCMPVFTVFWENHWKIL